MLKSLITVLTLSLFFAATSSEAREAAFARAEAQLKAIQKIALSSAQSGKFDIDAQNRVKGYQLELRQSFNNYRAVAKKYDLAIARVAGLSPTTSADETLASINQIVDARITAREKAAKLEQVTAGAIDQLARAESAARLLGAE